MREDYIGNTFFDATASAFVLPTLSEFIKPEVSSPATSSADSLSASSDNPSQYLPPETQRSTAWTSAHRAEMTSLGSLTSTGQGSISDDCLSRGNRQNVQVPLVSSYPSPHESRAPGGMDCRADDMVSMDICGGGLGPDWLKTMEAKKQWHIPGVHSRLI